MQYLRAARDDLQRAWDLVPDDATPVFGLIELDPYDKHFDEPAAKGLSYGAIEGLLDGGEARQQLLLMDTCHEGEADRSNRPAAGAAGAGRGPRIVTTDRSQQNAFDILQEKFFTVQRGCGASVIATSRGIETAAEDRAHGDFTQCLLDGLSGKAVGPHGMVSVTALKSYVAREVDARTGHLQRPITRRLKLEIDFALARKPVKK